MQRTKTLYKQNVATASPRKENRRSAHSQNRSKLRHEMYCNGRDISNTNSQQLSNKRPAEATKNAEATAVTENGENGAPLKSKRLKFLKRFEEWKVQRDKEKVAKQTNASRPPFVPAGKSSNSVTFAPPNHNLKPPVEIKNAKAIDPKNDENRIQKPKPTGVTTRAARRQQMAATEKVGVKKPLNKRSVEEHKAHTALPQKMNRFLFEGRNFPIARKALPSIQPQRTAFVRVVSTEKSSKNGLPLAVKKTSAVSTSSTASKAPVTRKQTAAVGGAGAVGKAKVLQRSQRRGEDEKKANSSKLSVSMKSKKANGQTSLTAKRSVDQRLVSAAGGTARKNVTAMLITRIVKDETLLAPIKIQPTAQKNLQTRLGKAKEESEKAKVEWPLEVQKTLDAVAEFRRQLAEQIARLHVLCDEWEAYKAEHKAELKQTDGGDMIDATIGQTKLLTSKKFMQFKGLIDRCEKGAKGEAAADDGTEATKVINAIDLEGFWSMLDIQVSDLDGRFKNLERWRSNNWKDPDVSSVAKRKVKKAANATTSESKNIAATAKASAGLQQMLRRMHRETRNKRQIDDATANCVLASPSSPATRNRSLRSSNTLASSQKLHVSLKVRDRKSHSITPTILPLKRKSVGLQSKLQPVKSLPYDDVDSGDSS